MKKYTIIIKGMKKIREYLYLTIGNLILTAGIVYFILPHNIVSGGTSTLYIVFSHFIEIDKSLFVSIFSFLMFILGFIILGFDFAKKTLFSTITFPAFFYLFENIKLNIAIDPLLSAIYGGILSGFGLGLTIMVNGSSGGMDIPPLILHKLTKIKTSIWFLVIDGTLIFTGIIFEGIEKALMGFLVCMVFVFVVEKTVTLNAIKSKKIEIISDKWEAINNDIQEKLERGTTIYDIYGGYSAINKKKIMCIIFDKQYQNTIELIHKHDEHAFIIVSDVYEVKGEGFSFVRNLDNIKIEGN